MPSESACFDSFSYLTAPNAATYRAIMAAFVLAKQRFVVHLRPEDVHELLSGTQSKPSVEALLAGLTRLVDWGNLRADPDSTRVTSVEDFHRARFFYQLTNRGEAVERALDTYDQHLGRRGALQAVALSDIAEHLRSLRVLAAEHAPDPGRVALMLRALVARFADLAENAQAFMGSVQRTIDLHDADLETFLAYKDRLIDYLERFIKDLVTVGADITRLLHELETADVDRLLRLVAAQDAEDAAPGGVAFVLAGGEDAQDPLTLAAAVWQERWRGLRGWFVAGAGHPSQSQLLRTRARAAIPQLLAVVATLNERRSGRSDRSADLRTLARWFAQAPDEQSMHRLWRVAFGLNSARHLSIDADTLAAREEEPVTAATPWAVAPPLRISPRLRRTGSYERRGKPNRIVDRSALRVTLERLAREQAEQTAAARARLVTRGEVRLSDLGELDDAAFGLFLSLLGDALGSRRAGQERVDTTTADGTIRVVLTTVPGDGLVAIRTRSGILRGPDHRIEIVDLAAAS